MNDLVRIERPAARYVVIGAGKTAMDACGWLLRHQVEPDRITWIRPRDGWFWNRAMSQPREQVASIIEGVVADLEAAALAESASDLALRLEACERLLRLDPAVEPTMFRCATMSRAEIEELRLIDDVVRLGHVRSVGVDRIVLDDGEIRTTTDTIHVDCTASGLRINPPKPVFEPGRITIQEIRTCQPTFNAALIGFVEATYADDERKNALCPPNPYPSTVDDMARTILRQQVAANAWNVDGEMLGWLARSRLNAVRDMYDRFDEPRLQAAVGRYLAAIDPAIANLRRMLGVPA